MSFKHKFLSTKISHKLLVFLVITSLIPIISLVTIVKISMENQLYQYKQKETAHYEEHFKYSLEKHQNYLKLIANDYAFWEDSYLKTLEEDHEWLRHNIVDWLPTNFDFTYTAVLNSSNHLLLENIEGFYNNYNEVLHTNLSLLETTDFLILDDFIYLVTIAKITSEDGTDSTSGKIIVAEKVDEAFLENRLYLPDIKINFYSLNGLILDNSILRNYLSKTPYDALESQQFDKFHYHFVPILNQSNELIAYGILEIPYDFYIQALSTLNTSQSFAYLLIILFFCFSFCFMKKHFIDPINHAKDVINQIRLTKKPIPINVYRKDEIGMLALTFNELALEIDRYNRELLHLSITDGITQLYNARHFSNHLDFKTRSESSFILVLIKLDFFKTYNNLFNRSQVDIILKDVAEIINSLKVPMAFRLGGSNFGLIFENNNLDEVTEWVRNFQSEIKQMDFYGKENLPQDLINASAGISLYPNEATTKDSLFKITENKLDNARSFSAQRIGSFYSVLHGNVQANVSTFEEAYSITKVLLSVIHSMDEYTLFHSEGVAKYALEIGVKLNLTSEDMEILRYGSLLHDVGKIELGSALLNKAGQLSTEEFTMIKLHPIYGTNILCSLPQLKPILPIVRHHHEWFNGTGYPDKLKEDEIPLLARIVSVADAYDSMTTNRPYRNKCKCHQEAILELVKYRGTQFDPKIVDIFISSIDEEDLNVV